MKFIIRESKRIRIITNYLNKHYTNLLVKEYPRWGVTDYFENKKSGIKIFQYEDGRLYIVNETLINTLVSLFNIKKDELTDIFIPWMEDNYGVKPLFVWFGHPKI